MTLANKRGLEFFLLSGGISIAGEALEAEAWGRLPAGLELTARVGPTGARVWLKEARLRHTDILPMPA